MSRLPYTFDPRLERAATIPADWYLDPSWLRLESERVFARTWQFAGTAEQVAEPGMYFTAEVAGEPVVIARGKDGEIRALSNVCRHRAGPVASGCGRRMSFQCGYHGWSYGLDGRLLAMREFEGVEDFRKEEHPLPQFELKQWGPLLFVRTAPDGPEFEAFVGELATRLGHRDMSGYRRAVRKDWTLDCNWKVYVDNYLEGYHIPIVHPSLYEELDYANYRTETARWYSIQHSPIRGERLRKGPDDDEASFFWLFPNLMLNVYPDNFSTNLIVPLGHERTLTRFEWFFRDPDTPAAKKVIEETVAYSDEIQLEDIAICEAVQKGLRSRTYDRGRYAVRRENGVHHFHGLLAEFLGDAAAGP
ncbi:MAG TPA: SRPBCC family protein [Thermoanaerobaculia bacterium]|nr:SRPBCC family protein [Thermoanaerobaculia bacterium]